MLKCLQNVVGITQSTCQCITEGLTLEQRQEAALSASGLYLDNLPGGVELQALNDMGACSSLFQMAKTALSDAAKALEDDVLVAIASRYTKSRKNFAGTVGRLAWAQSLAVSRPLQGMIWKPNAAGDTIITVNRIQVILNSAISSVLKIYRVLWGTDEAELIGEYPFTSISNAYVSINTGADPLRLPFMYNGELVEYRFVYDLTGTTAQPKDTLVRCGTCPGGQNTVGEYMQVKGMQGTPGNWAARITDDFSRGLIMDVEIKCDNNGLICNQYNGDDAVAILLANAEWFKAGELLIEAVQMQPNINRYTMMENTYLWGKRNHFRKEYEMRIEVLTEIIDVTSSNCFICRERENQPFFSGIIA